MQTNFTIGMAGHIDHGKTTLTKALTGINTDRLKEEKLRQISIEPGFARLIQMDDLQISIIDVPGHERFIRQMIAGVVGIDFVVLVVAADEGVMPQTKEHLSILSLLGLTAGLIAVTKTAVIDDEMLPLVVEDIREHVQGTFLENASIFYVDSKTNKGIDRLKSALIEQVPQINKREADTPFRLPIDQVFTVKGQGVVVRGTVFNGAVHVNDTLTLLPINKQVRVRQIQSHYEKKESSFQGQRTAINLGGISHEEIRRGDVLVKDNFYTTTNRFDVVFQPLSDIDYVVRQRQVIKIYIGTAERIGKIIFFDRNELLPGETEEVFCQIQLDEEVVITRGDRFIMRRATPIETIGGGSIIHAKAEKHRFGDQTIERLKQQNEGTPKEKISQLLQEKFILSEIEIKKLIAINETELAIMKKELIHVGDEYFTLATIIHKVSETIVDYISSYHENFPLRQGMNKAEIVSMLERTYPTRLVLYTIEKMEEKSMLRLVDQFVALEAFTPHIPSSWKKRADEALAEWKSQGANVDKYKRLFKSHGLPDDIIEELYHFLIHTGQAYPFDEGRLISSDVIEQLRKKLYDGTAGKEFTLQMARDFLHLSRKNLIPILELFDALGYTERKDGKRVWVYETAHPKLF